MKKILFSIVILSFITVNAQRKFGIIAGLNNPLLTEGILKGANVEFQTGINVGIFYEMDLNKTIKFRPRMIYSQQGDRAKESVYYVSYASNALDYKLDYINIPLDIKFWNKVYVIAGPQIGFLINEKAEGPMFKGPAKSSVDFGANLALGVNFKQTFLELGIYQGLIPVIEGPGWGKTTVDYHNALMRFSIGWRIF